MIVFPDWSLPPGLKACYTTRSSGYSAAPYDGFNLAKHVGDREEDVNHNRLKLLDLCKEPSLSCAWLNQTHGITVAVEPDPRQVVNADASISSKVQHACVVLTADCLPVLLCDQSGSQFAAVHAGWRGLAQGILTNTIGKFRAPAGELKAFLGPAISQKHFEVGDEVRKAFTDAEGQRPYSNATASAFLPAAKDASNGSRKWMADLYALARMELSGAGIADISGGDRCTYEEKQAFYSYRRDGETGRMATMIWKTAS